MALYLSAELAKTYSFRLFGDFAHWGITKSIYVW